jgi:hypothetical protein
MTPEDAAFAREFVASARWQTAVTVPDAPHQYSVDAWNDDAAFTRFAALIAACGYRERWDDGHTYTYLDIGEHRYWLSPAVYGSGWCANRARHDVIASRPGRQLRLGEDNG